MRLGGRLALPTSAGFEFFHSFMGIGVGHHLGDSIYEMRHLGGIACLLGLSGTVSFNSQVDQFVDQLWVGNSAGLPEFGIHADGGKAGDRVYLVNQNLAALMLKKEIDSSHARAFRCEKRFYR